jgi:ABC transporter substrate binding protein
MRLPPHARPAVGMSALGLEAAVASPVDCVLSSSGDARRRSAPRSASASLLPALPTRWMAPGLQSLGWIEGEGVSFEVRAAEGQLHLLPQFAGEMVSAGVDLIAVIGAVTVRAVRQATSTIPVVFAVVVEPIGDGLAADRRARQT